MARKAKTTEQVTADEFFGEMELPEGFDEVTRSAAKRLEPGESIIGKLMAHETRTGFDEKTGVETDYKVYTIQLDDGTVRTIGGAPVLDSLIQSSGGADSLVGARLFIARAAKNASGKRGRTAGMYKLAVAGRTNGKAKA